MLEMKKARPRGGCQMKYGCPITGEFQINKECFFSLRTSHAIFYLLNPAPLGPERWRKLLKVAWPPSGTTSTGIGWAGASWLGSTRLRSAACFCRAGAPRRAPCPRTGWAAQRASRGQAVRVNQRAALGLPLHSSCSQRACFLRTGLQSSPKPS